MAPLVPSPSPTPTAGNLTPAQQRQLQQQALIARLSNNPAPTFSIDKPQNDDITLGGIGSGIIDLLSRGVYASAGYAKNLVKGIQHDSDFQNPFEAAWEGLKGDAHNTYSDVIEEAAPDAPGWVKFTGGLAGDILLDPANLLLGGAGSAIRAGSKVLKAPAEAARIAEKAANKAAAPLAKSAVPKVPLNVRATVDTNNRVINKLDPFRRLFSPGYGFKDMHDAYRAGDQTAESAVTLFRNNYLKPLAKEHDPATINDAYSAFKRQVAPKDPDTLDVYNKLLTGIDRFANPKDPVLKDIFSDTDKLAALHKVMGDKGISFRFDPLKATTVRNTGTALNPIMKKTLDPTKIAGQIRDWDVKDPLAFFDQMHQAVANIKVKDAFGKSLESNFAKSTPRPGMVRLTYARGTELGPFIPKGKYFDKDVAERLTRMNNWLSQPTSFKDVKGGVGWTINHVVTPAMNLWKPFMTIARPGHHVRNVYSDVILSAMDGIANPGIYFKSKNMLQAGGAIERTGIAGLKELETGKTALPGYKKLSTVRLKGRNADVSADEMYKLGWRQGLFTNHHGTEDLLDSATAKQAAALNATTAPKKSVTSALLENPYMRAASKVSEQTNHYTRGAHFIGLMESKKFTRQFKTMEDAAAAAAVRVKRWHPDLHGLTPFERKNMRLAIPFYNWQRQTMPMILNAAISKPGRVTGLSKASYEVSKAMGLNPQSIGDPFPEDGVYPEFVRDNLLGPVANTGWGQIGLNTGSPQESLFGETLNPANPLRTLYGMANPIAQGAIEAVSGVDPSTGRPIINKSDWVDQQIPVVNTIAKMSGYSPSSIITKLLQGDIGIDQGAAAKRGTYNPTLTGLNWLTGVGASDLQSGTYRNIAQREIKEDK